MKETRTAKDTQAEKKNRFSPSPRELGEKVKVFIDRERQSIQGNLKQIARMVTTNKKDEAPVAMS